MITKTQFDTFCEKFCTQITLLQLLDYPSYIKLLQKLQSDEEFPDLLTTFNYLRFEKSKGEFFTKISPHNRLSLALKSEQKRKIENIKFSSLLLTVYSEQLNIQYKKSRYPRRSNANRYRIFYYSKMRYQSSIKNQNRIIEQNLKKEITKILFLFSDILNSVNVKNRILLLFFQTELFTNVIQQNHDLKIQHYNEQKIIFELFANRNMNSTFYRLYFYCLIIPNRKQLLPNNINYNNYNQIADNIVNSIEEILIDLELYRNLFKS
jgi:hypothetical protein|uniref:Uncharacterized protein n=2 Tax=Heterosigma akashiwo TaxID=2829 RepID=A0A224AMU4_HETAK|nr:hypothetical protein Heak452_Cp021 [Heterosigma akashiwo]BBA18283.1 hypothetical protein [Heterosigma akashiwo]BBA18422.1 hypothetical protein [Heterosigma akashiwo]BBA18560.1 hypothetical protein [Heterosigma akashiwo]BBA18699.1 hypothetical protein [Heterosigma akashiwo]